MWRRKTRNGCWTTALLGLIVVLATPGGAWAVKADLDGNGKDDIVWRNLTNGTVAIWLMNGLTIKQVGVPGNVPGTWTIEGVGDTNGDGKADLIWRNTTSGAVAIWLMNGLTIQQVGVPGSVGTEWEIQP